MCRARSLPSLLALSSVVAAIVATRPVMTKRSPVAQVERSKATSKNQPSSPLTKTRKFKPFVTARSTCSLMSRSIQRSRFHRERTCFSDQIQPPTRSVSSPPRSSLDARGSSIALFLPALYSKLVQRVNQLASFQTERSRQGQTEGLVDFCKHVCAFGCLFARVAA